MQEPFASTQADSQLYERVYEEKFTKASILTRQRLSGKVVDRYIDALCSNQ